MATAQQPATPAVAKQYDTLRLYLLLYQNMDNHEDNIVRASDTELSLTTDTTNKILTREKEGWVPWSPKLFNRVQLEKLYITLLENEDDYRFNKTPTLTPELLPEDSHVALATEYCFVYEKPEFESWSQRHIDEMIICYSQELPAQHLETILDEVPSRETTYFDIFNPAEERYEDEMEFLDNTVSRAHALIERFRDKQAARIEERFDAVKRKAGTRPSLGQMIEEYRKEHAPSLMEKIKNSLK